MTDPSPEAQAAYPTGSTPLLTFRLRQAFDRGFAAHAAQVSETNGEEER